MWTLLLLCLSVVALTLGSPARCGQHQHSKCRKEPPGFFERTCETYFDCKYQPNPDATEPPSVYFKCDNSKCACELFGIMREEFGQMAVGWDRRAKRCSASLGGMCGRQDGIEVFCDRGYECVNSKCDKVASLEKEEGCKNKQGCEFGQADPPCPDPNGCEFGRAPPATTVDYGMIDENRPSGEEDPKYNEVQPGDGGRRRPAESPHPPPSTSCEVTNSCEAAEPAPEPEGEQRFYRFDKGDPPGYGGSNDKEQQSWAPTWASPPSSQPNSRGRYDRKALTSRVSGGSVEKSRLRSYTKGRYQSSEEEEQEQKPESRRPRSEWRDREFRTNDRSTSRRGDHRSQPPTWFSGSSSRSKGDDDNRGRRRESSEEHQVRGDDRRSRTFEPTRKEHDKGQYSNGRDYERHGRSRSSSRSDDRTKSSRSAPEDFGEEPGITFTYRGSSSRSNNRRETQTSCGSKGGCGGSKGDRRPSSSGGCDKCGGSGGGSSSKRPSSCGSKGCKGGSNNRPEREDREGGSSSSGGGCGNKGACTTPKPHWSMPKPKENEGCGGSCGGNGGGSKGSSDRGSSCGNKGCGKKTTTERPSGSCGGGSCGGRRGSGGSGGGGHNFRPKTTARPRLPCGPENGCQKPKEEETSCEDNPDSAGCGDDKDTDNKSNKSNEDGCSGGNKGGCSGSREEKMAPSAEDDEMPCKKTNSCEEEADNNSSKCDKCGSAYNFYRYMNNSNPSPTSSPKTPSSGNDK